MLTSYTESPEVGDAHFNSHFYIFCFAEKFSSRIKCVVGPVIVNHNPRRKLWNSLKDVTRSNKLQRCGNAVQEKSTFLLNSSNLHAFVWVMEKAISGSSKNIWMPLKKPTR